MAESLPPAMRGESGQRRAKEPGTSTSSRPAAHRSRKSAAAASRTSGGRPDREAAPAAPTRSDGNESNGSGNGSGGGSAPAPAGTAPAGSPTAGNAVQRQAYAAIDLGTNNCRLLIARPQGQNFVVVDAFSRVVRLGEGLAQAGRLSDAAMDRALSALSVCADKLKRRNVHLARSVATEACRRASNGMDFIDRVRRETGIALDVISAQEEARLAVLGCHILLEQGEGPAMIFDIGGGSTELVLIENGPTVPRILDWQSVPWGVVSLTETCGGEGESAADRAARYARMRGLVDDSFATFAERLTEHLAGGGSGRADLRLLGTSGTVTTLASLHLELPQYDRGAVDGLVVPAESMRAISTRLAGLSPAERRLVPCIGRERADLVVAGCAILESILDIWPASRLGVADRGIREGILRSLMASGLRAESAQAALRRLRAQ
ncbi:Ppx/GppA family phosphatase [Novosphingobium flavum]|uniref:Ppx/GppA family phosphatase n=1 Tax=Novosphingobium flavum TaxID=1778672 RepID=A0A7X1FP19_9SPHN|nr:Ppx/GppA phosphatase family protein [Novosphingobium flavum]MBC2664338.1 Ppx/GppA family phosphatase [Novosphingobium flavum]